jgi:hypothetical protein
MVTIQVERWADFYPASKAVFPSHWRELALHQDEIPLSIDEKKYETLDATGVLLILTARDAGNLVGYFLWFLMPHLHYSQSGPMGMTDMYFVLPEYRSGTGARLFIASEAELRRRGVIKAITSCKVHEDHTQFLEKLGWIFSDKTFVKLLGGAKCP